LIILTISLTVILLTGCSQKAYVSHDCPTIKALDKIEECDEFTTNATGGFSPSEAYRAVMCLKKHGIKENYYDIETKRLEMMVEF